MLSATLSRAGAASCLVFAISAGASTSVLTDDAVLIRHRGQHPFNALFGLPAVPVRSAGGQGWQIALEQGNNFAGGREGGETLLMDGESGELALRHHRALGGCWQGEVVAPFVFHHGGWADRVIDDWHQRFGLPDAERDVSGAFDVRYAWTGTSGETHRLDEPAAGPGDVHVTLQRSLSCDVDGRASVPGGALIRLGVKLPSGDPDRLLGSGATDVYADALSPILRLGEHWRLSAAAGVLATGDSSLFDAQRPLVAYGSLGVSLRLRPRWEALLQLDWHTPLHDSALRELGATGTNIVVGARYRLPRGQSLELSIAEDAVIDTYPDIVARLAWTWSRAASE